MEECPPGCVFVVDSRGDPKAASAGGILLTRLMARGVAGAVTDGGFRDTPDLAVMPWPTYHAAPSAPTNLIRHHAVDTNLPIGCGEVPVYPGDIMVGDGEGWSVSLPTWPMRWRPRVSSRRWSRISCRNGWRRATASAASTR
ncbi:hypothetical protein ACFQU2_27120 [Siccirubricoccus deserti]